MESRYERSLRRQLLAAAIVTAAVIAMPAGALASPIAQAADRDCADFSNQAAAQDYFIERGGPGSDPDRLDGDGDGVACDSLPCPCSGSGGDGAEPKRARTIRARVVSVTDGDTLKVRYGKRRRDVRVIGIDTPETKRPGVAIECGGPQASAKMERLAPKGAKVTLRTDPTQDTIDRYGRLLAYVGRAGRDLGRAQIAAGWAKTYVYAGNRFRRTAAYRRSEKKARRLGRGVHGLCGGDFHSDQPGD
ncbi:MAG: thermonuclease family protein [Thermoleophilaceae bacterium]